MSTHFTTSNVSLTWALLSTCMSQAQTTLVGYFLGYQGLEKEPELLVSKPPHRKFSSARKSIAATLRRGSGTPAVVF